MTSILDVIAYLVTPCRGLRRFPGELIEVGRQIGDDYPLTTVGFGNRFEQVCVFLPAVAAFFCPLDRIGDDRRL